MWRAIAFLMIAGITVAGVGACVGGTIEPIGSDEADAALSAPDAEPGAPDAAPDAAPGAESLSVQFDTTANGGPYAPKNVVAVWIEGPGGIFEKTIGRWAGTRVDHLVAWVAKSGLDADAISGATRANHTARLSVTWDLKDKAGAVVPDGTYTIRMELADSNASTAGQNHQASFTFAKNGTAAQQTALTGGGFVNVSIDYSGR